MTKPKIINTDFRALCAELVSAWDSTSAYDFSDFGHAASSLVDRARAALVERETGPGPSFADVERLAHESGFNASDSDEDERGMRFVVWEASTQELSSFARAVLARYGSAPRPIPVSERLPGAEDCDAEGRCWWWDNVQGSWYLQRPSIPVILCPADLQRVWLPAHALPIPTQENADG